MTVATAKRDGWLRLDDASLLKACREERYRSSGPGGQRRNKVETSLRLHHDASGVSVQAEESRELQVNRVRALRRLRERIALDVRTPFDVDLRRPAPELLAQRGPKGTLAVNRRNAAYPVVVATVLDALAAAGGSYARAGRSLGLTTSQVLRFLRSDSGLHRAADRVRSEARS